MSYPIPSLIFSSLVWLSWLASDHGRQLARMVLARCRRRVRAVIGVLVRRRLTRRCVLAFLSSMRSLHGHISQIPAWRCGLSSELFRVLLPRHFQVEATPNHALQRTATAVTVAAIAVRGRLVRSERCPTSVAALFAPPSQLPRQPSRSLSLGSLGRCRTRTQSHNIQALWNIGEPV